MGWVWGLGGLTMVGGFALSFRVYGLYSSLVSDFGIVVAC